MASRINVALDKLLELSWLGFGLELLAFSQLNYNIASTFHIGVVFDGLQHVFIIINLICGFSDLSTMYSG